jgi:hypothetical protein
MQENSEGAVFQRRSGAEAAEFVREFEPSGLRRKEFCAKHGLSVHTLDAWRRAVRWHDAEEIYPVELVEERQQRRSAMLEGPPKQAGQLRVVLSSGLRIEIEAGFEAAQLRRLIAALEATSATGCLSPSV